MKWSFSLHCLQSISSKFSNVKGVNFRRILFGGRNSRKFANIRLVLHFWRQPLFCRIAIAPNRWRVQYLQWIVLLGPISPTSKSLDELTVNSLQGVVVCKIGIEIFFNRGESVVFNFKIMFISLYI